MIPLKMVAYLLTLQTSVEQPIPRGQLRMSQRFR